MSCKTHNKSMRVPFIGYADFESFTPQPSTCQPIPEKSYSKQYQKHIPSRFCYHIKCFDDILYSQQPVTFVSDADTIPPTLASAKAEVVVLASPLLQHPPRLGVQCPQADGYQRCPKPL